MCTILNKWWTVNLCLLLVLEIVSGDYGDYTDLLCEKAKNGLNTEWRKSQSSAFNLNAFDRIGK